MTGSAAQVYQDQRVPAIFGPWAPRVLDLAAPAAGERHLDTACGTGVVARLAAGRVGPSGRVVGLDLNPGMLAVAAALPPREGGAAHQRIGLLTCSFAASPYAPAPAAGGVRRI